VEGADPNNGVIVLESFEGCFAVELSASSSIERLPRFFDKTSSTDSSATEDGFSAGREKDDREGAAELVNGFPSIKRAAGVVGVEPNDKLEDVDPKANGFASMGFIFSGSGSAVGNENDTLAVFSFT
jgi:hypothetical protein